MDQVEFVEMVCLGKPDHFNFFKGRLPQILLGLFLNTLPHNNPSVRTKIPQL